MGGPDGRDRDQPAPARVQSHRRARSGAVAQQLPRTRPVVLRAADGTRLSGWLMTPQMVGPHPASSISATVRGSVLGRARRRQAVSGHGVLAVNYRGYGDSHGDPAETTWSRTAALLFDWMSEHPTSIPPDRRRRPQPRLRRGGAGREGTPGAFLVLITPYDSILALAKRNFRACRSNSCCATASSRSSTPPRSRRPPTCCARPATTSYRIRIPTCSSPSWPS